MNSTEHSIDTICFPLSNYFFPLWVFFFPPHSEKLGFFFSTATIPVQLVEDFLAVLEIHRLLNLEGITIDHCRFHPQWSGASRVSLCKKTTWPRWREHREEKVSRLPLPLPEVVARLPFNVQGEGQHLGSCYCTGLVFRFQSTFYRSRSG